MTFTEADEIPIALAKSAHSGTSFVPERRAQQERDSHRETLASDYAELEKLANTDEKRQILEAEFARYRVGLRGRKVAFLSARSRMVSTMIAGGSNFPVRQQQKRGETAQKRLNEYLEFRERALNAIRKKLTPELRPIMSGDADAQSRLAAKIAEAERKQENMKACNAAIRKNAKAGPEAQVAALVALGCTETTAKALLKPDFCGRIGFPDYALQNNNANIRRMKERQASIERASKTPETEIVSNGIRMEDCPPENRVRLFFSGKPSSEIRDRLKANGFRWAPSNGCWQAYRNHRTIELAKSFVAVDVPAAV